MYKGPQDARTDDRFVHMGTQCAYTTQRVSMYGWIQYMYTGPCNLIGTKCMYIGSILCGQVGTVGRSMQLK